MLFQVTQRDVGVLLGGGGHDRDVAAEAPGRHRHAQAKIKQTTNHINNIDKQ